MEIRLLGPIEAFQAGAPLPLGPPRRRALLAVLALAAGRTVATSRLIDDLWGEHAPASAPKMLQILVSQLRKVLPAEALVTRAPGYELVVARGDVDAFRAEGLLREGRAALGDGDPETASRLLSEALSLWRGPALAEFLEPFAAAEGRRLEELRLAVAEERIDAELAVGRHAAVVAEVEELIAAEPLRERPRGQLMLALYRCDRQADALRAYADARTALSEELGLDPSARLRDLERRILQQDPAIAASAPSPRSGSLGRRDPEGIAMVGRVAELDALHGHLEAASSGDGRVVLVTGEAGLGKTTLVRAFTSGLDDHRVHIARGQCIEHHGGSEAYLPVLSALERLCRAPGGESLRRLVVDRAPTWAVQMPWLMSGDELSDARERVIGATPERMLREIIETLAAAGDEAPIVLVIEDLHWSDPSTLDLLRAIARGEEGARLLVVATLRSPDPGTRSEWVAATFAELTTRGLCPRIALPELDESAVGEYLRARVPGAELPAALPATLLARTGGNPLFVQKAVESWIDDGKLRLADGAWTLDAELDALAREVPSNLRQLIRQRLLSLEAEDLEILRAASAGAPEFSAALVAAACGRFDEEVEDRCDAMAGRGLFLAPFGDEAWPDGTVAGRYGFTHDLVREVLYLDLPAGRRARVHRDIGSRLEAAYGESSREIASILASHFVRAGDAARALPHLADATRQAIERLAPREAVELADTALGLVAAMSDDGDRTAWELTFLFLKGPALVTAHGWTSEDAERVLTESCDVAARLGRPDEAAWSSYQLACLFEIRGDYPRSEALMQQMLAERDQPDRAALAVASHEQLACSLLHQGEFRRALDFADRAAGALDEVLGERFIPLSGADPGLSGHTWAAQALWHLGLPDAAAERAALAVATCRERRHRFGRGKILVHAAVVTQARREVDETRRLADEGIAAAAAGGFAYWQAMGEVLRGWAVAAGGAPDEGIGDMEAGIELSRRTGARMDESYFLGLLADALLSHGEPGRALEVLDRALPSMPRAGRFFYAPELQRLRGVARAARGDAENGEAELRGAVRLAHKQGGRSQELRAAVSLGGLLRSTGRSQEAQALVASAYGEFAEGFETHDLRAAAAFLSTAPPGSHLTAPADAQGR